MIFLNLMIVAVSFVGSDRLEFALEKAGDNRPELRGSVAILSKGIAKTYRRLFLD